MQPDQVSVPPLNKHNNGVERRKASLNSIKPLAKLKYQNVSGRMLGLIRWLPIHRTGKRMKLGRTRTAPQPNDPGYARRFR